MWEKYPAENFQWCYSLAERELVCIQPTLTCAHRRVLTCTSPQAAPPLSASVSLFNDPLPPYFTFKEG